MNTEVERKKSFGEVITEEFQKSYAHVVIELEFINLNLKTMLMDVQQYCQEVSKIVYYFSRKLITADSFHIKK